VQQVVVSWAAVSELELELVQQAELVRVQVQVPVQAWRQVSQMLQHLQSGWLHWLSVSLVA
jgi:hypothetical protein